MKLLYGIEVTNQGNPAHPDYAFNKPMVRFRYLGGATGTPKIRIYKDGDVPPAWTNVVSTFKIGGELADIDVNADYRVEYQDNSVALKLLGIVTVHAYVGGCYEGFAGFYNQYVTATRFSGKVTIALGAFPTIQSVSIDEGVTWKNLLYDGFSNSADYSNAELALLGYVDRIPNIKLRRNSSGCMWDMGDLFIGDLVVPPFSLSETHTNETAADADDGTATITVTGGSGNFTYLWNDGPTTKNRSNLPAGTYTLTVTDVESGQEEEISVTITEPAQPPSTGTFLHVPFMNSVHFVNDRHLPLDDIENPQGLDNRLLCEQYFAGYSCTNYFQKICKVDVKPLQFHSDFSSYTVSIILIAIREQVCLFM